MKLSSYGDDSFSLKEPDVEDDVEEVANAMESLNLVGS